MYDIRMLKALFALIVVTLLIGVLPSVYGQSSLWPDNHTSPWTSVSELIIDMQPGHRPRFRVHIGGLRNRMWSVLEAGRYAREIYPLNCVNPSSGTTYLHVRGIGGETIVLRGCSITQEGREVLTRIGARQSFSHDPDNFDLTSLFASADQALAFRSALAEAYRLSTWVEVENLYLHGHKLWLSPEHDYAVLAEMYSHPSKLLPDGTVVNAGNRRYKLVNGQPVLDVRCSTAAYGGITAVRGEDGVWRVPSRPAHMIECPLGAGKK